MVYSRLRFLGIFTALFALAGSSAGQLKPTVLQPPPAYEFPAVAYFAQTNLTRRVARVLLSGQLPRTLVSGETTYPNGLGVDPGRCHVYAPIGPFGAGRIARVNTDGTGLTTILSHPGFGGPGFDPRGVALDLRDGRVYWISPGRADRIGSCTLNGGDPRSAVFFSDMTPQVIPHSIHVDETRDRIYWWDQAYQGFRRADVDSSGNATNLTDLCFTGPARSFDVDVKNQMLYWTISSGALRELRRAPIPATPACDLSVTGYTVFANEVGARNFFPDVLSVSPEVGVVAWSSLGNELSWKPIEATLADPNRRSVSFPYMATGGLEVVPGPAVCIAF